MTTGRAFERLVAFTDAVVAVAITLLILPIIGIRGTGDEQTVWTIISDHSSEIFTFLFTFLVVGVMWLAHNRAFDRMRGFDGTVFMVNLLWLAGIVLLPWASSLYGEGIGVASSEWSGGEGLGGAGMFYWSLLAALSLLTSTFSLHVKRHPELIDPENARLMPSHPLRMVVYPILFLLIGVISLMAPVFASWLPFALFPIGYFFNRAENRMRQRAAAANAQ